MAKICIIGPSIKYFSGISAYTIRLANALTIHNAQGLTLDSAFVDVRAAREPGQAYVALSRVRTLAGLHLKDWPKGVFVSQRALDFHFPQSLP